MTREFIKQQMAEIQRVNDCPFKTFYLRHTDYGITSNRWGTIDKLEEALNDAERSREFIQGVLPISLLVLINEKCVHVWTKNPLWSCVDDEDDSSHVYTNVPLIGNNGWFVDPKYWLDIDTRKLC